ncbi:protein-glutamate methylesterase/protein-glutamine glutaminase [Acetobacterium woodii]|uniref:Protein-glutamate methylesterase/protein-glutamine glutaminase n=1 Tax=Acetobacterium woodii (strain ATCC 29683 / DSM 1030 / JCM 2381 / KCTC 1655 / WB1) TaxID=931626 RepID=H6LG13_ACEWD|nr:chemotaxis response regulator protein-glutamate methylesterase [Acetobacterium woodii]AFA48301.1 chemotaxis-specific methylesterase CheB1 [Acetobacterium woodii DSM 1030]
MRDKKDQISVLIVDDSIFFREIVSRKLSMEPFIYVIATANNPFDARDKILKYDPDVVICDVEMPKMNGIEFIRRLLPQYPLPVIVVSSNAGAAADAKKAGALYFVEKPKGDLAKTIEKFIVELTKKIRIAAKMTVVIPRPLVVEEINQRLDDEAQFTDRIIAIGASTGGTEAIYEILKNLPSNCPGIVIVQHIPPMFSKMFAQRLDAQTMFQCKEAATGDYLKNGWVYIAPGDKHMRVKRIGKKYRIEVFEGERVNGHCPSVDILFESVAKEAGAQAIGVLLTGMGYDGAKGLLNIRRKGALTIGQDEATSVVYGMNKVAFNMGAVTIQASLEKIHTYILSAIKE